MHCPKCDADFRLMIDTCPTCGVPLDGELPEPPKPIPELPMAWLGLFFVLTDLVLIVLVTTVDDISRFSSLFRLIESGLIAFWLWCVSRLHEVLRATSEDSYSTSPAAAVGWHFLPVFNLYWVVKWPQDVARFAGGEDRHAMFRGTTIGILFLVGWFVRYLILPLIGTILLFGAMQWLVGLVRKRESRSEALRGMPRGRLEQA